MPRIEEWVDIVAPPTTVFRLCHDLDRRPEWDERVMHVELLTSKPIRTGTLLGIDACHSGGSVFSWEAEYTSLQFPRGSELRVIDAAPSAWFGSGGEEWQFGSVGDGTRFTLIWDYQPRGFLGRILDILFRSASMRRDIKRSLANLKGMVESG